MDTVLLIAHEYLRLEELRQALDSTLELCCTDNIVRGKELLASTKISVLVLDCAGDAEMEYGLLRWVEENCPQIECIALVDAMHFCPIYHTRRQNLFRLLKPVEPAELAEHLLRTVQKVERASSRVWAEDPTLRQRTERQFWLHLLSGMVPSDEESLNRAAPPALFQYQQRQQALCVLFCLRRWHEPFPPQIMKDHRFAVRSLARHTLLRERTGCAVPWQTDMLFIFLYGPEFPSEEELRGLCERIVTDCGQWCGCDVSCYFGTPCLAHQVPEQSRQLIQGNIDNVTDASAILSLAQISRCKPPLSPPVLRDWMPYFVDGRVDDFCRCIDIYFQQAIAANSMDRAFLTCFQQDFIQEIGFALKNAGISFHKLFSSQDALTNMEAATRYVPDMLEWVRDCAIKAIALITPDQAGKSVSQRVCDYLDRRLLYPFRREEIARALNLSEGHISRTFRKEMGMSIAEYLARQRVKQACLNIQQTGLPLTQIAEQCGFRDYPSFYRTFKKCMGLSPTEFQIQKSEFDI